MDMPIDHRPPPCAAEPPLPPPDAAYFLDIDGTLLEIADTPSAVRVDHDLLRLVCRLHRAAGGAFALISGRRIADIDALFPGLRLPLAGQHGIERRDADGRLHVHDAPAAQIDRIRGGLGQLAAGHAGLLLEDKGTTMALHYRHAPHLERSLYDAVAALAANEGDGFRLQPGKMVFEIQPAGKDKGTAIGEFLQEAPFRGRLPVFIGDDITDEYGFRVVNACGGSSIKVGAGVSEAQWCLVDVVAVHAWLARCLGAQGTEGETRP
jgi:trehalose 6-phosphate phosphatase